MPDIRHNLSVAFHRALANLRDDPYELDRRLNRMRSVTNRRPLRGSCLCIRASDTRLDSILAGTFDESLAAERLPHNLTLTGPEIRKLTGPVKLDHKGTRWTDAADMLGVDNRTIYMWIKRGVFEVEYTYCHAVGYRGKPCPHLWCDHPLDPNMPQGRAPDPLWGLLWWTRHHRIPDNYKVTLHRVPTYKTYKGQQRFDRWAWQCPGIAGSLRDPGRSGSRSDPANATRHSAPRLYLPLPISTIAADLGPEGVRKLLGDSPTSLDRLFKSHEVRNHDRFACKKCCGVIGTPSTHPNRAWSQFVTHISGGLLYGYRGPQTPRLQPTRNPAQ